MADKGLFVSTAETLWLAGTGSNCLATALDLLSSFYSSNQLTPLTWNACFIASLPPVSSSGLFSLLPMKIFELYCHLVVGTICVLFSPRGTCPCFQTKSASYYQFTDNTFSITCSNLDLLRSRCQDRTKCALILLGGKPLWKMGRKMKSLRKPADSEVQPQGKERGRENWIAAA